MQISVTKRITPFRDGVAFVYYDHKDIRMLHSFNKHMILQSFGSDIEKIQLALARLVQYLIDILFRAGHINIISRNTMSL